GDELAVGGLALDVGDGVAEELLQRLDVAAVPGDLDGVADGPLHAGGRGVELPRHLGIEHLGDGVDDIHIIYRKYYGFAQVLIALDVGGDADLVDDVGDDGLQAGLGGAHGRRARRGGAHQRRRHHPQVLQDGRRVAGLGDEVAHAQ